MGKTLLIKKYVKVKFFHIREIHHIQIGLNVYVMIVFELVEMVFEKSIKKNLNGSHFS